MAIKAKDTKKKSPEVLLKTLINLNYRDLFDLLKPDTHKSEETDKNDKRNKETDETDEDTSIDDLPESPKAKPQDTRQFDGVKPIERPPIPRNQAIEKGTAHLEKEKHHGKVSDKSVKGPKKATALTSIAEEDTPEDPKALEEAVIDKYLAAEIPLPLGVLAKLSPSFRRAMIRRLQLKEIKRKPIKTFYESLPQTEVLAFSQQIIEDLESCTHVIEASDLAREEWDDHFEVLSQETNGLPARSIIQKDVVEQYFNEQDASERGKIIIVARPTEALRCIYPNLNNHPETIEALLDMGSQIICIDKEEAIGRGLTWDSATFIHMQSANGSLNRTQGLARNVPLTIGPITIYAQFHVIERAPYKMLLGRPFDVLTKMGIQTYEDGRMEIMLTCPNTRKQITMGTYERGRGIKPSPPSVPKLKDMGHPDGPPSDENRERQGDGNSSSEVHFQGTSMNY
ncbi:hypothetical protein MPER_12845 [Moniliophthora perniciosa FA553]|nr:hypothetical protein MPER_12845 [Moniliophthora perniciosa FA553]